MNTTITYDIDKCLITIRDEKPIKIQFLNGIPYLFINGIGYKVEGECYSSIIHQYLINDLKFLVKLFLGSDAELQDIKGVNINRFLKSIQGEINLVLETFLIKV